MREERRKPPALLYSPEEQMNRKYPAALIAGFFVSLTPTHGQCRDPAWLLREFALALIDTKFDYLLVALDPQPPPPSPSFSPTPPPPSFSTTPSPPSALNLPPPASSRPPPSPPFSPPTPPPLPPLPPFPQFRWNSFFLPSQHPTLPPQQCLPPMVLRSTVGMPTNAN